jgi:RHS repeat-associated protein
LGRRIGKIVDADGASPQTTYYFYAGDRAIEERNAAGSTTATYVYGRYIDEVLTARRDVDGNGTAEDYFFHADDLYNVTVVTDATGGVVERYEYGAFGQPTIYAPDLTVRQASAVGNTLMFNGRPYDAETGFYYYRTRYLEPRTGRFTTRDTIGIWGDPANLGNGYAYVRNNPWTFVDPYGEQNPTLIPQTDIDYWKIVGPIVDKFGNLVEEAKPTGGALWAPLSVMASRAVYGATGAAVEASPYGALGAGIVAAAAADYAGMNLFFIRAGYGAGYVATPSQLFSYAPNQVPAPLLMTGSCPVGQAKQATSAPASAPATKMPNEELQAPPAKRGNAPTGSDGNAIELHHRGQTPDAPLDEMTREEHRGKGNFGKNHWNTGEHPSQIDRNSWKNQQRRYWEQEWDSGRFNE